MRRRIRQFLFMIQKRNKGRNQANTQIISIIKDKPHQRTRNKFRKYKFF